MENIREEVVDIRSCIAYLMVKWKVLLLALLIGALVGGGFGFLKQKNAAEPAQVTYEEKLQSLRSAIKETDALYVEQACAQYRNYGKQLGYWNQYLAGSALQRMEPDSYVRRDIQYIVESDNSDVISSFSVSLLGTADYERIAQVVGDDVTASNAVELITVSNVTQADSTANLINQAAAVQSGGVLPQEGSAGMVQSSYRSIMDITFIAPNEEKADAMEEILEEILKERQDELLESSVDVDVERLNRTTVANDYKWLLAAQQTALAPMQSLQTTRSNFFKNTVEVLGEKERAYFDQLILEETQTQAAQAAPAVKKVNMKKYVAAGGLGFFVLAFGVLVLMYIYSDKIRAEQQLIRNYMLPVLARCRIGKGGRSADPIRNWGLGILTGAGSAQEPESAAGKLAAELAHRITGGERKVYLAYDADREEVRSAVTKLTESLRGKGLSAQAGRPSVDDEAYRELLEADAVVAVETMNASKALDLKDILGICRRNSLPVLGCVTLTDTSKY